MTLLSATSGSPSFWSFYREYARSGVHAATAAGVTIFGLFASLYWEGFIVAAVAVYVLPLVGFYLATDRTKSESEDVTSERESGDEPSAPASTPASGLESNEGPSSDRAIEPDSTEDAAANADAGTERTSEIDSSIEAGTAADSGSTADTEPEADSGVDDTDGNADETTRTEPEWVTVETPTDDPLYDAVVARGAVFAVGDDGTVLVRQGEEWTVALERGPTVESNPLWGADATEDGEHVWFCGDSGVLGQYDVAQGKLTDRSAPRDRTGTWANVTVVGPAGDERVHLVNGSGEVLRGRNDDGELTWDEPVKPGSGSSLSAVEFADRETGYCCDSSQGVFETTDGGKNWERIGVEDAGADFTDLALVRGELLVATDDGSVVRYDDPGWTELHVGEDPLYAIDWSTENGGPPSSATTDDDTPADREGADGTGTGTGTGLLVGDDGAIYERVGNDWTGVDSPTDDPLYGVVVDRDSPDVTVGEDGTVLERGS